MLTRMNHGPWTANEVGTVLSKGHSEFPVSLLSSMGAGAWYSIIKVARSLLDVKRSHGTVCSNGVLLYSVIRLPDDG